MMLAGGPSIAGGATMPREHQEEAKMAVRDTAHRKLTYEDYVQIPDDGKRHEIIDGVHYASPSPTTDHQDLAGALYRRMSNHVYDNQLGKIYFAPLDVVLSGNDIVQPDILFISAARLNIITAPNIKGAPDLVVEILSDSNRHRDETLKRERYDQLGVQEYWIIDPRRKAARIFRRTSHAGFGAPTELTAASGQALTTPLLPGLEIPLREIFS
jgi:Uma2 family endonuclease